MYWYVNVCEPSLTALHEPSSCAARRRLWCKLRMRLLATLIGALTLQHAGTLMAQERAEPQFYASQPITHTTRRISLALLVGYGFTLDPSSVEGLNAFAFGFGARGGFAIDSFYVGMRLLFFMGDSRQLPTGELTFDETMIGLEGGYDIALGRVTLRPQVGVGLAMSSAELMAARGVTEDRSSDVAYVSPGLSVTVDLTRRVFVAADTQVPIVLRDPTLTGLSVMLATGMRF